MTQDRLSYILKQIANKSNFPAGYASPWVDGDLIYATNGTLLLCLKNEHERDKTFVDNGAKHPNARTSFALEENSSEKAYVELDDLDKIQEHEIGLLLGKKISGKCARKAVHLLRLFGLKSAFVKLHKSMFEFDLYGEDGLFGALCCMCNVGKLEPVPVPFRTNVETYYYQFALCDDDRGQAYYHKCLEEERKAEAEYNKENFDVYVVTLKKTTSICVRAKSYEEAEKIALDKVDDWDFHDSPEVDCYEESCRDNECNYYVHYYDKDGKQDWDKGKK